MRASAILQPFRQSWIVGRSRPCHRMNCQIGKSHGSLFPRTIQHLFKLNRDIFYEFMESWTRRNEGQTSRTLGQPGESVERGIPQFVACTGAHRTRWQKIKSPERLGTFREGFSRGVQVYSDSTLQRPDFSINRPSWHQLNSDSRLTMISRIPRTFPDRTPLCREVGDMLTHSITHLHFSAMSSTSKCSPDEAIIARLHPIAPECFDLLTVARFTTLRRGHYSHSVAPQSLNQPRVRDTTR